MVYHARQELEYVWEERFQQQYGVLRDEVLQVLDEYLNCGLLEHGAARVYCDSCKHSLLVAFSCITTNGSEFLIERELAQRSSMSKLWDEASCKVR